MNRMEIVGRLAARTGLSKAIARDAVDGVFAIIGEALADGEEAGELARKIAVGFAAPVRGGRGAVHCKGIGQGAPALTRCDRSGMLVI